MTKCIIEEIDRIGEEFKSGYFQMSNQEIIRIKQGFAGQHKLV
jgi:hypothetical protein